jgi:hypothetical protein
MDLQTIRNRISEQVGISASLTNATTRYNSWINETYKRVASEANWPWLLKHDIIQTVAEISTGTVAINSGATALTFSSAPAASVANDYRIQIETNDDWYDITAHTAGATDATLSDAFTGASNVTAATYLLRKVFYSLPSDLDRILTFRQARSDTKLTYVDIREFDRVLPDPTSTGDPFTYSFAGLDSSNNWRAVFYPTPDEIMNLDLRYYQLITDLSADTDTPIFPNKWHQILVYGALAFFGWDYRDDNRRTNALANYNKILDEMKRSILPTADNLVVISPWDLRISANNLGVRPPMFPPDFGVRVHGL